MANLARSKIMDFGYKKKHQFQFGEKTERTHCPRCMRSKDEAIAEQVALGQVCDDSNCCFSRVIREAIRDAQSNKYCICCGSKLHHGDIFCTNCGCRRIDNIKNEIYSNIR